MPVTMQQVLAQLNREEPNYRQAAQIGEEALPHLLRLVKEGDPALASKATYLAAFINAEQSPAVVEMAARSSHPIVRVAAAGSLRYLKQIQPSLILPLLNDQNVGVRKWALKSLQVHRLPRLKMKVREIAKNDPEPGLRELASELVNQLP